MADVGDYCMSMPTLDTRLDVGRYLDSGLLRSPVDNPRRYPDVNVPLISTESSEVKDLGGNLAFPPLALRVILPFNRGYIRCESLETLQISVTPHPRGIRCDLRGRSLDGVH